MKKLRKPLVVLFFAAVLGGCDTMGPKETLAALGGAAAGAYIGSQTGGDAAVAIGTLVGAVIGQNVGRSLDRVDRMYAERAAQRALERNRTGSSETWRNPNSGNRGITTPIRSYQDASGRNCREYETKVVVGGRHETAYGTACRQSDGTWRVISSR